MIIGDGKRDAEADRRDGFPAADCGITQIFPGGRHRDVPASGVSAVDDAEVWNPAEMGIPGEDRQPSFQTKRGNPDIVDWNQCAALLKCRRTPKVYQAKNGLEDSKCTTFEGENGSS